MITIEAPNIFRGAPIDYNIRVMKCKKSLFPEEDIEYLKSVASIIQKEQGYYPLINTKNRTPELVESRQILAVILLNKTPWTQSKIGKMIGSKDHATIVHSKKTVKNHYETEKSFKLMYDRIESKVKTL